MMDDEPGAAQPRHAVILCHPDPASFNHAIAHRYCEAVRANGQHVVLRDLYALGFDPVLKPAELPTRDAAVLAQDVQDERAAIAGCDVFVLVYPLWFGSPPAMMKGYIERVFGAGIEPVAVQQRARSLLLGGKRLLTFTTAAGSRVWLDDQGLGTGLTTMVDQYLVHAFGMRSQEQRRFANITRHLDPQVAGQHLNAVTAQANRTCAQLAFGDEALLRDPSLTTRLAG
jgi:NAD(P)H dehydrogenase (quinone)